MTKQSTPGYEKKRLERFEKTCLAKFGVRNPIQSKAIQDKRDATIQGRFGMSTGELLRKHDAEFCQVNGVANVWQIPSVRERILRTNIERYGVPHAAQADRFKEKTRRTNLSRYGVEHPFRLEETKRKREQTSLVRYGVKNAMFNPKVLAYQFKRRHLIKEFLLPSGRRVLCQGYEPLSLTAHLSDYGEEEFLFNGELHFSYIKKDGKEARYTPDFAIKTTRKAIEVKSPWTLRQDRDLREKILAVEKGGWVPVVEVWDGRKLLKSLSAGDL